MQKSGFDKAAFFVVIFGNYSVAFCFLIFLNIK